MINDREMNKNKQCIYKPHCSQYSQSAHKNFDCLLAVASFLTESGRNREDSSAELLRNKWGGDLWSSSMTCTIEDESFGAFLLLLPGLLNTFGWVLWLLLQSLAGACRPRLNSNIIPAVVTWPEFNVVGRNKIHQSENMSRLMRTKFFADSDSFRWRSHWRFELGLPRLKPTA